MLILYHPNIMAMTKITTYTITHNKIAPLGAILLTKFD